MSILYDDTSSEVTFVYDYGADEIVLGPFHYDGGFKESTTTSLTFTAQGDGWVGGEVDHWSILSFSSIIGDVNGNGILDATDIDQLSEQVRMGTNDLLFDFNADALVNDLDRQFWLHDLKQTYFGDGDLSGSFNTADLVQVLASGEYEDDVELNSTWLTGDWDGDGDFTSGDLVVALADGGYEQGPRASTAAVPEPTGIMMAMAAAAFALAATTLRPKTRRECDAPENDRFAGRLRLRRETCQGA
jgi:hypothetical protein